MDKDFCQSLEREELENFLIDRLEELEQAKEMYRTISRVSPVGIYRTDEKGRCVYVNEKWRSMTGMTSEEALGDGWKKALHPDDRYKIVREWNKCVNENRDFYLEYRFLSKKGEVTWVLGQANVDNGGGKGYVGSVTDITERKEILSQVIEIKNAQKCRSV